MFIRKLIMFDMLIPNLSQIWKSDQYILSYEQFSYIYKKKQKTTSLKDIFEIKKKFIW